MRELPPEGEEDETNKGADTAFEEIVAEQANITNEHRCKNP